MTEEKNTKVWCVVDVGCIECGVKTVLVGCFASYEKAMRAHAQWSMRHQPSEFRDGGQHAIHVFETVFGQMAPVLPFSETDPGPFTYPSER